MSNPQASPYFPHTKKITKSPSASSPCLHVQFFAHFYTFFDDNPLRLDDLIAATENMHKGKKKEK